ncbi:MAG: class I SAM-dependent methyltransferase [Elusimicrobia bacterium]|nr:class I SAM-dependent methyltransferase [Candidatus Liberimonas magnetica]
MTEKVHEHHLCPWWMGYWLISPFRKLMLNPEKVFTPFITVGMRVLEVGSGMGFFTVPFAKMVGESGKVVAVDIQKKMIDALKKRLLKRGLSERVEIRECKSDDLNIEGLKGSFDLVFAFAVVHEMPDRKKVFKEFYNALKPKGLLIYAEPKLVVKNLEFKQGLTDVYEAGFFLKQELTGLSGTVGCVLIKQA